MPKFEATPTEYKGITYRSKCEAMFARYLDLLREEHLREFPYLKSCGFEYEPSGFDVDGWSLDFLQWKVISLENPVSKCLIPTMHYSWIEYKPSSPTKAYCKKLAKNFASLIKKLSFYDGLVLRSGFYVFHGSVFNNDRGVIEFEQNGELCCSAVDWLAPFEDEIRATRFDLEAAD